MNNKKKKLLFALNVVFTAVSLVSVFLVFFLSTEGGVEKAYYTVFVGCCAVVILAVIVLVLAFINKVILKKKKPGTK
jgi:hypothetical protein